MNMMKKFISGALFFLILVPSLSASSSLYLKGGLGILSLFYESDGGSETLTSGYDSLSLEADWDIFLTENTALNIRSSLVAPKRSIIDNTSLTDLAGYGIRAGADIYLGFLRIGGGIRFQAFYAGESKNIGSIEAILSSLSLDIIFSPIVVGIEYAYALGACVNTERERRSVILKNEFLNTGALFIYTGVMLAF